MSENLTPMLKQYHRIKAQHPDMALMFRMGDFYEMFFEDAITASKALNIALTKRGASGGQAMPLAGAPWHQLDAYLAKFIRADYKVTIADQFGLLTIDGEPKPDFAAYNTLTAQLRGKTPEPRLVTAANVWALPFRRGDEWIVVCWREEGETPTQLRLESDARSAETVDIMGNERPLTLTSGAASLDVSFTPVFARFSGAKRLSAS